MKLNSFRNRYEAAKTRRRICATIAGLLDRQDILILDTETTGLRQAEVIEISMINTCGETLLDTLVCPRMRRMNPYAQQVHGITLEMLDGQPTWPEVLPELKRLTAGTTILAWNASFDARMLEGTSIIWNLSHPKILFACAMRMYSQLKGGKQTGLHKAVAAEGLGHLFKSHASHRALGDVHFVLEVIRKCTQGQ